MKKIISILFLILSSTFILPHQIRAYSADTVIFQDEFTSLDNWQIIANTLPNQILIDPAFGYKTASSLLLDYKDGVGGNYLHLKHDLDQPTSENLTRVFFYDDGDQTLGTVFNIYGSSLIPGTDKLVNTALGVVSSVYPNTYAMRLNTFAETKDTRVKRSVGWHMFEMIVTTAGTYAKIDNELIMQVDTNNIANPLVNNLQQDLKTMAFVSTWELTGQAHYDGLLMVSANTKPWQEQFTDIMETHYNIYKNTSFAPLYQYLGDSRYPWEDLRGNPHSNDLRSLFSTANSFYLYGKQKNNPVAVQQANTLFRDGVLNGKWDYISEWARGVVMGEVTRTAYVMWTDLNNETRNTIKNIIFTQAQKYLDPNYFYSQPQSGYVGDTKAEENGWHAYFLAEVVNYFPDVPNRTLLEEKAKCFAYHTITTSADPIYCDLKTQTVHDDFRLENHYVVHPVYGISAIHELALGAMAYEQAGQPIPEEFKHNVVNLYTNFLKPRLDPAHFHPVNNSLVDWSGAHKSLFSGGFAFEYVRKLGTDPGFSLNQLWSKRSIFYYQIAAVTIETPLTQIDSFNQSIVGSNGYNWFLNSVQSGEFGAALALLNHNYYYKLPGDLNNDQTVDIFDLRHFLIKLFNPYTIFDYNKVVENFGG